MVGNNFDEIVLDESKDVLLEVLNFSLNFLCKQIIKLYGDICQAAFVSIPDICSLVRALPIT